MNSDTYQFYRHSGKFSPHGLALALIVPIAAGFLLGYVYAYLIKWIPFIYLNIFITAGYGGVIGFLAGWMLRVGKVRNNALAGICGLLAGLAGLYLGWNGHVHAYFEDAPVLCQPGEILKGMGYLYAHGSWTLKGEPVTGVILGIVWGVEALMIVGLSTLMTYVMISGSLNSSTKEEAEEERRFGVSSLSLIHSWPHQVKYLCETSGNQLGISRRHG